MKKIAFSNSDIIQKHGWFENGEILLHQCMFDYVFQVISYKYRYMQVFI
jgi:hypothetical protein